MNITDLIVLGCSVLLIWRGASRGFVRSILGPICLILATLLATYYFNTTKNILIALLIGLFGPMALHFFLSNYLKLWHGMTNPEWKPNPLSRISGAALTLIWGWVFIGMTLILLTILPNFVDGIKQLNQVVRSSVSYGLIKPFIHTESTAKTTATPAQSTNNTDIAQIANDPRFQEVINDPDVQQAIAANDFTAMMSNPKIMALTQQLMQDPDMIKKLLSLQGQLQQNTPAKQ